MAAPEPPRRPSLTDVHSYWSRAPIFSLEVPAEPGTAAFFDAVDRLKRTDVERFGIGFWRFDRCRGLRVLELGCGSGWLSANYALGGANLVAIDLTARALEVTRKCLAVKNVRALGCQANAEALPFQDGSFDLVVASGVIHHTPDVPAAASEIGRVLQPGGTALVSVYYRNLLLQRHSFWLTRRIMRWFSIRSRSLGESMDVDDFVRRYDGDENPLGRAYSRRELRQLFALAGLHVKRFEVHYFPTRLLPIVSTGGRLHRLLDHWLGTMLYAELQKSCPTSSARVPEQARASGSSQPLRS